MLSLAQNAHNALTQLVEYIVSVAAVLLAAGCIVAGTVAEFTDQLLQGDVGILDQRFHGVDRFQAGVEIDRVIDAENGFANFVTTAGSTAFHLLIENARANAAHKHQITDFRHINTGG